MPIASAQVKSSVLLAGLFGEGSTTVIERTQTRDHTERMLGLTPHHTNDGFTVSVKGGHTIQPQSYRVPGDISSAAFLIAAALIVPNSEVCISQVGLNPTRSRILDLFRALGARIQTTNETRIAGEPVGDLVVKSSVLQGNVELSGTAVAEMVDEIPIIAVTLAASGGGIVVHEAADLRSKESDRIRALTSNLRRLGLEVDEYDDGFAFQGKNTLLPSKIDSFGDHRIAMAFGIAGLAMTGETIIENAECVDISFPTFWDLLHSLQSH
jgi:3-phosphoshikimate 1-carboxyvinyltransferase